jgi:enoyl-CoA hydratase/carnithine racemase
MTDNDVILYAVDEGVATISFNRPDKLAALTPAMHQKFLAKADAAASDTSVRVILITGSGREFSPGPNLSVTGGGVSNDPGLSAVAQDGPAQWADSVGTALSASFGGGWNKLVMSGKAPIAAH